MAVDWAPWDDALAKALRSNKEDDWSTVDRQLIQMQRLCGSSLGSIRVLIEKIVERLGHDPTAPSISGDPSEVYVENGLLAVHKRLSGQLLHGCFGQIISVSDISDANEVKMVAVSDAWCETLGYQPDEVIGRNVKELMSKKSADNLPRIYRTLVENGVYHNEIIEAVSKTGKVIPIRACSVAGRDSQGRIVHSVAVSTPCV